MFSFKKIILIGLIVFLLIAIPVVISFVSQQLKSGTTTIPSTSLSLSPNTQKSDIGQDLSFGINIDPGTNSITQVKLVFLYDAIKLATEGAGFVPNVTLHSSIIEGPIYAPGVISMTVNVGVNNPAINKPHSAWNPDF